MQEKIAVLSKIPRIFHYSHLHHLGFILIDLHGLIHLKLIFYTKNISIFTKNLENSLISKIPRIFHHSHLHHLGLILIDLHGLVHLKLIFYTKILFYFTVMVSWKDTKVKVLKKILIAILCIFFDLHGMVRRCRMKQLSYKENII